MRRGWNDENSTEANEGNKEQKKEDGMSRRVVITGIGPVTSLGIGREPFFTNLCSPCCPAQPVPASFQRAATLHSKWYVPLPEFALADHGVQLMHESLLQAQDRMALLATKLAFEDAGFSVVPSEGPMQVEGLAEAGVILGAGLSGLQTALESHLCHALPPEVLCSLSDGRRPRFNRMAVPKTMTNAPTAWVSICFGLHGACHTLNASCASGTYAIGEAFRRIKDGYGRVVLAGGVEAMQDPTGFFMRGFDVLGVLTQAPDGRPRPFSRRRSGFLFAEGGACLLVLEDLEHAQQRGAAIYAEVADYRANSDASNIVQIDPEGRQMRRLLGELSSGRKIDYLNSHGTGTVANDDIEAHAIQKVFGDQSTQPWLNSTKGLLGHTLGASGAIEAAVTALAIARGVVHGNLTDEPIPDLNLPLEPIQARIENALSVSYGFGGHNAGLLFKRYSDGSAKAPRTRI